MVGRLVYWSLGRLVWSLPGKQLPAAVWLALFGAGLFTVLYVITAVPRIFYPYDLDFVEDGMLMASLRLAHHQPIFIPPQAGFVPHVYMPLYPWLGGLLFQLFDPGFAPLRLLSLAAVIIICGLIYRINRRESGLLWPGLVGVGLFLGGYRVTGFWYELVRVDSLYMALVLAGLSLGVYRSGSRTGLIGAGFILALAFFTKQTGLLFGLGLAGYLLLARGWPAMWFGLTFSLFSLMPVLILNTASQGWFLYYTFHIAAINPLEPERVLHFAGPELFGTMAGLSVMALLAGVLALRRRGLKIFREQPWLVWIGVGVLVSGLGRASVGGNLNNLLPAYTLLCLAPAVLVREWSHRPGLLPGWRDRLVALLVLAQFGLGVYNPSRYIPTPAMRQAGDRLIEQIREIEGEVLVLMHPYYVWLAGKEPSAQMAALWHARDRGQLPLPPDLVARIEQQQYAAIISDQSLFETEPQWQQLLTTYYRPAEKIGPDQAPPTMTGMVVRPSLIYRPKSQPHPPNSAMAAPIPAASVPICRRCR